MHLLTMVRQNTSPTIAVPMATAAIDEGSRTEPFVLLHCLAVFVTGNWYLKSRRIGRAMKLFGWSDPV